MTLSSTPPEANNPPAAEGGVEDFSAGPGNGVEDFSAGPGNGVENFSAGPGNGVEDFLSTLAQASANAVNPDVLRVVNIPRKSVPHVAPEGPWAPALGETDLTRALLRPGVVNAPQLFPVQSRMLIEANRARGLVAYVGVGRGKTPVVLLLPTMWNAKRPLLLTRASLVPQLERAATYWGQWFRVQPAAIRSHHLLSTVGGSREFLALAPDAVVIDEADFFNGKTSARTKLLVQYIQRYPSTRVAVLSGTLLRDSIVGPDHLSMLALRERSPLPTRRVPLETMARAVDAPPPGELRAGPGMWQPLCDAMGETDLRRALGRRLEETVGVVISQDGQPLPALNLHTVTARLPQRIQEAMAQCTATWCLPDGQQLKLAVELFTCLRQLSKGFYYRPVWNTPDGKQDLEWLELRAEWSRRLTRSLGNEPWNATRARLEERARQGVWTPREWKAWEKVKDRHGPEGPRREAVWLDDSVLRLVADEVGYPMSTTPAVVWVLHRAVGQRLAEMTGWRFYADGPRDAAEILDEGGTRTIIASIPAHGAGKDLQAWSIAHWLEVPGSNHVVEQLLGRHHRFGQRAHCVDVHLWALSWVERRALLRAEEADRVPAEVTRERRKLLYATRVGPWPEREDPAGFDAEDLAAFDEMFDAEGT